LAFAARTSYDLNKRSNTISKKLGYRLSPQPPFETGALVRRALVDRCVVPVDRNGITSYILHHRYVFPPKSLQHFNRQLIPFLRS
jgi:hypothetical protein